MKVYYVFGLLCALVLAQGHEMSPEFKKILEECGKEAGVDEASKGHMNSDDPKMNCFHACIMKKKGIIMNGKVSADKQIEMMAKFAPDKVTDSSKPMITECANKANEEKEECKVAGVLHKCIVEKLGPFNHKKE